MKLPMNQSELDDLIETRLGRERRKHADEIRRVRDALGSEQQRNRELTERIGALHARVIVLEIENQRGRLLNRQTTTQA